MKNKIYTDDELKERHREAVKRYREKHPIKNRANVLFNNYKIEDKKYGRIGGQLPNNYITRNWIVENILFKPCAHCDKKGWDVIGCNRLDNSKPHTIDNVEPCCEKCNHSLATEYQKTILGKPLDKINKITGEVLASYISAKEASRINKGFSDGKIRNCAEGGYFDNRRKKWVNSYQYKGYVWKYHLT